MAKQNTKLSGYNPNRRPSSMPSYLGLPRISSWKKFANLLGLDTPNKLKCDCFCTGRSMVEMLGVLAIVGVLSVGAIAGYSKAMRKYRLNKQAEQINSILNSTLSYGADLGKPQGTGYSRTSLIPILKKLNAIPMEMNNSANNETLTDAMGSQIVIYAVHESDGTSYYQLNLGSAYALDVCVNTINTFKANADILAQINISCWEGSQSTKVTRFMGDNYCSASANNCIRNMTVSQINDFCLTCKNEPNFIFGALWNLSHE